MILKPYSSNIWGEFIFLKNCNCNKIYLLSVRLLKIPCLNMINSLVYRLFSSMTNIFKNNQKENYYKEVLEIQTFCKKCDIKNFIIIDKENNKKRLRFGIYKNINKIIDICNPIITMKIIKDIFKNENKLSKYKLDKEYYFPFVRKFFSILKNNDY